jgi:hypothetical protein
MDESVKFIVTGNINKKIEILQEIKSHLNSIKDLEHELSLEPIAISTERISTLSLEFVTSQKTL